MSSSCSFQQAVKFVAQVLGLSDIEMDDETAESIEITKAVRAYRKRLSDKPSDIGQPLSKVLASLKPDTVYYPKRGVSQETISRYHISFCDNPSKPFYNRAFFPVLDNTGKYVVGWSARSIFDKCSICKLYHSDNMKCPSSDKAKYYVKWNHSTGFKSTNHLYNLWYAQPFIAKYGTAIVCEGPGDVWALEESGIKNSVAMFGLNCSKQQRRLLQKARALTLVFILDNDESAKEAVERLKVQLMHYFRIFFLTPQNANDIGEMVHDEIRQKILPFMEQISMKNILETSKEK